MKIFQTAVVVLLAIVLWGCPYTSAVGIDDKPGINADPALLGTWRKASFPSDSTELQFSKSGNTKYELKATLTNGLGGYDHHHFEAWFSAMNHLKFLTLYDT